MPTPFMILAEVLRTISANARIFLILGAVYVLIQSIFAAIIEYNTLFQGESDEVISATAVVFFLIAVVFSLLVQVVISIPCHRVFAGEQMHGSIGSWLRWNYTTRKYFLAVIGLIFMVGFLAVPLFALGALATNSGSLFLTLLVFVGAFLFGCTFIRLNLWFPAIVLGDGRGEAGTLSLGWSLSSGKLFRYMGFLLLFIFLLGTWILADDLLFSFLADTQSLSILFLAALVTSFLSFAVSLIFIGMFTLEYTALLYQRDAAE